MLLNILNFLKLVSHTIIKQKKRNDLPILFCIKLNLSDRHIYGQYLIVFTNILANIKASTVIYHVNGNFMRHSSYNLLYIIPIKKYINLAEYDQDSCTTNLFVRTLQKPLQYYIHIT